MHRLRMLCFAAAFLNFSAWATTPAQDYSDEFVRQRSAVTALGPSLFGDNTGLSSGVTEFATTDVDVPGNSALLVRIARRYRVDYRTTPLTGKAAGLFNDWDLDIPHLHGTFAYTAGNATSGWQVSTPGQPNQRCSVDTNNSIQAIPPPVNGDGSFPYTFQGYQYWHGNSLYIPGQGEQTLMVISPSNANRPTDGADYRWLTSNQWMVSCLATTANGIPGEGFLVVSPDGTKYRFDWFAKVYASPMTAAGGTFPYTWQSNLARQEQYIFPTRIEDRFGNYVTYTYDPSQPMRLKSIHASDGRDIALTYNAAGTIYTASTTDAATAVTKTWTYAYAADGSLSQVTLPDSSKWQFATSGGIGGGNLGWRDCADIYPPASGTVVKTITHPSGAVGAFTFQTVRLGRSYVPKECGTVGNSSSPLESKYVDVVALMRKEISGPGMATSYVWTFAYGADNASWTSDCTSAPCATTRQLTVTEPDGSSKRHTFSNRYDTNEGALLSSEVLNAAAAVVKSDVIDYQWDATGQPYPARLGKKPCYYCDTSGELLLPSKSRTITQQGQTFSAVTSTFDVFANPAKVTRSSSLGYSRTETTVYNYNKAHWVLDQIQTVTEGSTGAVMQSNAYDPATAALTSTRQFGQPATTMTYYTDGTLWTQKDGAGNTTTFSNYKRGLPRNVAFADNTSVSVVVNDFGQITSFTNAAGYTTGYQYDLGGRLSNVTYPTGDATAWNNTTLSFAPVAVSEYGLAAGHWKQTIATGNGKEERYFDALWRPVVVRSYDAGNLAATQSYAVSHFDSAGRTIFAAYPVASLTAYTDALNGVSTTYDALGRVTQTQAASELGTLTTSTQYLTGFQTKFTDARNNSTTTTFQAFDTPSTDAPHTIAAPAGVNVTIIRDIFGKPTSIQRSGLYAGATVSATRSYVYDANQRLCKTIEPERGATVQNYDTANRLWWTAPGTALTSTTSCDTASVTAAQKTSFGYDTLNRLISTTYGDGNPSISRTYTPDGLPYTISSDGSVWTYTYNHRRLLTSEALAYGGSTYSIGYGIDANAHVQSLTYPDTTTLNLAPNALGEAKQVGGYANTITRYPNRALASFNYGNGIAHSTIQNTRDLPGESKDTFGTTKILDDVLGYDANANPTSITDNAGTGTGRTLGYDALNRLTSASGAWGSGSFAYDPLDNVRTSTVGARSYTHNYNSTTNRLTSLQAGTTTAVSYLYDALGNLSSRNSTGFVFDQGNRLRSVPGIATYHYDGLGRRTQIVPASGAAKVQVYSQGGQLLYETSGGVNTRYMYLDRHLIASDGGSGLSYVHTDGLGSPVAYTNSAATVTKRVKYEPYGAPVGGVYSNGPGYTGHVTDAATQLSYMQQRYYDPIAARFLSNDPAAVDGSGGKFNRYAYALNNPYRNVDPDGRETVGEWLHEKTEETFKENGGGGGVGAFGMVFAETAWKYLGAEGVSQVADKGSAASTGDKVSAGFEILAALPPVKIVGMAAHGGAVALKDGAKLTTEKALDAAIEHLGQGYKEIAPGVFKSADGTRMVRMTESDLAKTGNHAGAPHMNFETGKTVVKPNGKEQFVSQENKHIFLTEEK